MPVSVATVNHVVWAATFALIDDGAVMIGIKIDNGVDEFAMFGGQAIAKNARCTKAVSAQQNKCLLR